MKLNYFSARILLIFFSSTFFSALFASNDANNNSESAFGIKFLENKGQVVDANGNIRSDIKFKGENNGVGIYIRDGGLSYVICQPKEISEEEVAPSESEEIVVNRVDVNFVGASTSSYIEKYKEADGKYNFYLAHCPQGITDVKGYYEVCQKNIYNGIDVRYYGGKQGSLKYDIVVNSGGDPTNIKLEYKGAKEIKLEDQKIKISTVVGEMTEWMPRVYQTINGDIIDVKAEYVLEENILSFKFGVYNSSYPLIIDPTWVTYYGGAGDDKPTAIDSDNNSNAISTGYTTSNPFPTSVGPTSLAGGTDAYLLSLAPAGSLVFCTYFGGAGADRGNGITIDPSNNIYLAGSTASAGPGTVGKIRPTIAGGGDAFVAMFNNSGVRQWCTYYGGTGSDEGVDVEIDLAGDILLTGVAGSSFPSTLTATTGSDIFLAKFNSSATSVVWSTCIGSNVADRPTGLDVDPNGNAVVTGLTAEVGNTGFPVTNGSTISNTTATTEGVVIKFNNNGNVAWSTYLGSRGADKCIDVVIDSQGDIVVTGHAWFGNPITQFSPTPGAFQTTYATSGGATYIIKFDGSNNSAGAPFVKWFTYFGTNIESTGIRVDQNTDDIFISGEVYGNGIPAWGCAHQKNNANPVGLGDEDHLMARFDKDGNFLCDTYIGGNSHDEVLFANFSDVVGGRIAIAKNGSAYLTGSSMPKAGTWAFPVVNGVQMISGGGTYEAVVISICAYSCGKNKVIPSFSASKTSVCPNEAITFTDNSVICDRKKVDWLWSFPGATTASSTDQSPSGISYPANGTYSVKLVITTPCGTDSVTQQNYITVNSPMSVISAVNNVSCFGQNNGGGTVGSITGAAPFTYNWNVGGSNANISGLYAGIYSVTVTDNDGCTSTANLTVTEPPLLTLAAVQTNSVSCYGTASGIAGTIVNGGTNPYTYLWNTNAITSSISSLTSNTYSVTVTDNYGCTATSSIFITEPMPISVTVTPTAAKCNGSATGIAIANASGGTGTYSYNWNTNTIGSQLINVIAGVYTVTITDANGCAGIASDSIAEPTTITLRLATTYSHCNQSDGSASVVANGGTPGYSYSWNNLVTSGNNNFIPAGNYSVTITDNNLCTATGTVSVTNLNGVTANIASSTPTSCNGFCDGSAAAGYSGGIAPYTYNWNIGGANANIAGLCAGTFSVTITDSTGCTDVAVVNITQPMIINSALQSTPTSCFNGSDGSLSITNTTGGTAPYNYSWQSGSQTIISNGLTSGTYSVIVIDQNGCTGVFASIVTEPTQLIINTSDYTICAGASVALTASGSGATPTYNYSWISSSGGFATGASVNITPNVSSTYSVIITDSKGCTSIGYSSVTVNELPIVNFTSDVVSGCGPLCVAFTNQTPNAVTSNWNFGSGISAATGSTVNHCFDNPGSYSVALIVADNNGCSNSLTQNNYITVHPDPIAAFTANPNSVSVLEPKVHFTDKSVGAINWSWSFGDIVSSFSSIQHPTFDYRDTGSYMVTLLITNEFGCSASVTDIITVIPDYSFFIPNSFSPNKDGKNDVFIPLGIGWDIDTYEFYIYNRWGELIFTTDNPSEGWNGSVNNIGEAVQQDVYVWKIKTKDVNGKRHQYKGHVTLIR